MIYKCFYLLVFLSMACSVSKHKVMSKSVNGNEGVIAYDDTRPGHWPEPFRLVETNSSLDGVVQKSWFYGAEGDELRPLLVSLHTWSGDFNQKDTLAKMAVDHNWNYIHPDFRGPNWSAEACCSLLALEDIDEAIDFAISQGNVDPARIFVNGVSGGGYAALAVYMRSRHPIRKILAWVPISDLTAWYEQSVVRGANYANHILQCTNSGSDSLDVEEARRRSPLFWETPRRDTRLMIYAGVYDGIQGSVPITHTLNFYNKVARDLGAFASSSLVSPEEKVWLLEHRKPIQPGLWVGDRGLCLRKKYKTIEMVIFEGNHEMIVEEAANNIFN